MESAGAKPEKRVLIGKLQKPKGVENIPYCICSRCHSKALIMPSANRRRQRSRHILLTAPNPPRDFPTPLPPNPPNPHQFSQGRGKSFSHGNGSHVGVFPLKMLNTRNYLITHVHCILIAENKKQGVKVGVQVWPELGAWPD